MFSKLFISRSLLFFRKPRIWVYFIRREKPVCRFNNDSVAVRQKQTSNKTGLLAFVLFVNN